MENPPNYYKRMFDRKDQNIDIAMEFLRVDDERYSSGQYRFVTPLYVNALSGNKFVRANIAELDNQSIALWYSYHKGEKVPEEVVRNILGYQGRNSSTKEQSVY